MGVKPIDEHYLDNVVEMATALLRVTSWGLHRTVPGQVLAPIAVPVQVRGKKQQKKPAKTKKDSRREVMKEYLRKMEEKKVMQEAALRAAKHGEPLDPEMLNPARKRPPVSISEEERERRFLLVKEYSRRRMERHKRELGFLQGAVQSRQRALQELRQVSIPLYLQALELNKDLFPFSHKGPTATPPLPGYLPPELEG